MGRDYALDVFLHLQETMKKVDRLSQSIGVLKKEHAREIGVLKEENRQLKAEVLTLRTENRKLKEIINTNSGNSSKPPSSDGFYRNNNSREKTGRKTGGQPGHKGHGPKLFEKPTEIVEVKEALCGCGGHFLYGDSYRAKQLADIEVRVNVTEYRLFDGKCSRCGAAARNSAPVRDALTYGDNLKSVMAILSLEGYVSLNRSVRMISELTGGMITLSEGTVVSWLRELAAKTEPAIQAARDKLLLSPVLHKDETGVWVNGKLHWLHVLSNKTHTLYHAHQKRGNDADRDMDILPAYGGTLVHDHLKGLYAFNCTHAECNAHILRYLKKAVETKKRAWAADMIALLIKAKNSGPASAVQIQEIVRKYDEIIQQGHAEYQPTENYNGDDMKLLRRMEKYKTEHLRFLTDPAVPFDNNQAERDLRMIKAKQKISGCFRAQNGAATFATLKSFTSTLRKQNQNLHNAIRLAFARLG